ncbi:MAG: cupin domain-containing protein [Woeseiaceae bacterium]|nr:cupin domain-containing protein [Woeseiaceae bacterium]
MRIEKSAIPVKVEAPGAVARQMTGFGDATGYGVMGAEYFSLAKGADMAPLLKGLDHDMCHSPHWGYVIDGELTVTYRDGTEERAGTGDMFYWPPYHTVRTSKDSEFVLFSPQHEHTPVMDHVNEKLANM